MASSYRRLRGCATSALVAGAFAPALAVAADDVQTLRPEIEALKKEVREVKAAAAKPAAYNFGVSGAPAAGVGADPQALALGIRYRF